MTNHVHLLITPYSEQGIGKTIQTVGRYYVQYFNYSYRRTGTPHLLYRRLGTTTDERQAAYRAFFKTRIKQNTPEDIRASTNKAWVLGDERFKAKIERQLNRRTTPLDRGGDRKSERYQNNFNFNRV